MKGTKVYALMASKGEWDDYTRWTESIHISLEGAKKAKKIFDDSHLFNCQFPMPEEKWEELRYGYNEESEDLEFVDRGGYTAEQFKLMHEMKEKEWEAYHPCEIQEFKILE
ncbi:hypothetical protein IR083_21020 [Dysgonomonas sp. GY75]|uniref:hypothetical protein n=1 Tax=Dysgonomonas sp. GY75 TaxID=2780419 RepID=UPI001883C2D5|nr:hypothetical protein [Dysgonomonas sp. GY75]MBF0651304.1 hypothetical protein [Dysgonomonas sp. GY75]